MNENTISTLFNMCNKADADLNKIEQFIVESTATPEEITCTAIKLANANIFEIHMNDYSEENIPSPHDLITSNWEQLFDIFIHYGLLPNLICKMKGDNDYNIMEEIFYIDNGNIAPIIMRKLLEHGGDPNINIDGEHWFSYVDFKIVFDVVELNNKRLFDIEFKIWLVLMGYGGYIKDHECPVKMNAGYTPEIFKKFEDFDYSIEHIPNDWIMHIYRKSDGKEIATL